MAAKDDLIRSYPKISTEEFKVLNKVVQDVFFFILNFVYVIHPVRGKTRFDLYPFQKVVLWQFITQRFNIILKFRQAGITELIAAYCLWLACFHPNKQIQIISIKDRVAKKVLRRIKYMYRNLPDYLKTPIVNGRGMDLGTATEIEFINGSMITSLPTTEDAGRSEALSLLIIDEAAIVRWASKIWAAAFPTLSTGGTAILNSTPYGVGNFFHKTWVDAEAHGNEFNAIRLNWQMHPERDMEWYRTMASSLGPRRTAQEIDGDFLTSGNSVFDLVEIKAIEDSLTEVDILEKRLNGLFHIVRRPKPNTPMYIGADVSSGRANDYSAFSIKDRSGLQYGYYKGKIPIPVLAKTLMAAGKEYNNAVLAPEANDIGLACVHKIQDSGYSNLFFTTQILKEKGEAKPKVEKIPGWYTTSKTRPIIIDELENDIRNDQTEITNPFFVQEAYTFIYDERNRPVAMGKGNRAETNEDLDLDSESTYTDDSILAESITNYIRKGKVTSVVVSPK
jgi:hypothetical protein